MPVTGNMEQEHSTESTELLNLVDSGRIEQTADSSGGEVSSTTSYSDFISRTSRSVIQHVDSISEQVQSTSIDGPLDSVDGLKDNMAVSMDASVSKSSSANLGLGFQDVFAAFASSSYREAGDESPVDVCKDIRDPTTGTGPQARALPAADTPSFPVVDSCVSSAVDSSHIDTTAESLDTPGAETLQSSTIHTPYSESQMDTAANSESVYFIQTTDASGQVVTSIIDPVNIPSYTDSVIYKQCMRADGEIETTIVYSPGITTAQEHLPEPVVATAEEATDAQHQIIYAHDINGHLTPIDSTQSFSDVAPTGKQFVYMQDSTGRIIRTIMDADQTMVPGQQVYYTQSDDGRMITSVMDPAIAGESEEAAQGQQSQESVDLVHSQQYGDAGTHEQETGLNVLPGSSQFNMDNNMSGLTMLAELSHLTAGQAFSASGLPSEHKTTSSTDSSSIDQDDFQPIATVTRPVTGDQVGESVSSDIAGLKVDQEETLITKIMSQMRDETQASLPRDNLFVQWQNLDAMCWMDVVLIMLVNSPSLRPLINLDPSHELSSTLLITLLKANRQAQILLQNILKKSNGLEVNNLQTDVSNQDPKASKLVCKENMDEIGKAINILYAMREKIWQALQPRLRCERGKHNSPVLVLPLIIREKPAIKQMFTMNYRYVFKCNQCQYSQEDSQTKILPSIPEVPGDFNMKAPCFVRSCFECSASDQRMFIKFEVLHDFVQIHFVKGLPHNRFEELNFDFNGDHYQVTAVVHYKNNPDHFIAWVRNAPGPAWMECDDLKSVITCYSDVPPNIPPSQVHMVMWERRLTSRHTLVMRDTEDTKLLASLVLTVQQPNTQQSAGLAARASGIPSNPATTTSTSQPHLDAGTMTSTTSLTPRPRGRGSIAGRGHTTSTPFVRRVTPTLTQLPSTTNSNPNPLPQIIRLPLSALGSSGLSIRGGLPTGTRYVLVGNSSQTVANPARTPPVSKVVVVRSQGGAANISAAQLLQLLQRTGAISQTGTHITTTVTTGANSRGTTEPSTTSYIIQQDGTIVATPAAAKVGTSQISSDTSLLDPTNEQQGALATDSSENKPIKSCTTSSQTISTLPYVVPASSLRGHAPAADASNHPQEPSTSAASSSQIEPSTSIFGDSETTTQQAGFSEQTSSHNQQPMRYVQVPNPAGGGTLLCQLAMKDGKAVLVPVEKTAQTQASGASVFKLSATPSSSSPRITIRVPTTSQQVSTSSLAQQLMVEAHEATSGTTPSHRFISLPGAAGNKKIQLITVPHGANTPQTSLQNSKTIIISGQQTSTTSSIVSRLVSPVQGGMDSRIASQPGNIVSRLVSPVQGDLSQPGNIVVRDLMQTDPDNVTTPSLAGTGHSIDTSSGCVVSTQTVSVLKNVPARLAMSGLGMSLLTSPTKLQKSPENFRYILPGSNTTHVLHTGPSCGLMGQAGKAFTALSSSGTIIGGQLTPSPTSTSVETSPMDQDLVDSDGSDQAVGLLTSRQVLSRELDTIEYIPLGRGRGKARGQQGGRAHGGRTPRVRGKSQLWSSEADLIVPVSARGHKISTLADLRQIGAHVIDAGSETVDGVPVVSIPDFSTDRAGQREVLSAAQSIISENVSVIADQGFSDSASQLAIPGIELDNSAMSEAVSASPRVITQPIPSYIHTHGYDILTQGILGATRSASLRQARSLLTGVTTTVPATSPLVSPSLAESALSLAPAASTVQQVMGQAEIETLIQAAQAAAKPSTTVPQISADDISTASTSVMRGQQRGIGYAADNVIKPSDLDVNISEMMDTVDSMPTQQDGDVESMDESRVSAAERYQMPVELFQPDEGSPLKSVGSDDGRSKMAVDFPSRLLGDAETSPTRNEAAKSRQKKQRRVAVRKAEQKLKKVYVKEDSQRAEEIIYESCNDQPIGSVESRESENSQIEEPSRDDASMVVDASSDSGNLATRHDGSELSSKIDNSSTANVPLRQTDVSDVLLQATEEKAANLPVKKVGRHQRRSTGSHRRQGSRRKPNPADTTIFSDISSPPLSDASSAQDISPVDPPDSSHERKTVHPVISLDTHSPDSSPAKYSKQNSANASFGSDLLLLKSDDEKEHELADRKYLKQIPRDSHAAVTLDPTQQTLNIDTGSTCAPAFVRYRKEKVNWDINLETGVWPYTKPFFSYKVLTGRPGRSHTRHPSLRPASESYISMPYLPIKPPRTVKPHQSLPAIVITRHPRPRQKPNSDPAREPTVIPLVMEDNCDPSCMGGSVVTSIDGAEMFSGVVVRHKRERTNWSTSIDEEEEFEENETDEEEVKAVQQEFCKQLMTVLYIHAGDFSAALHDLSDVDSCGEEKVTDSREEMYEISREEMDEISREEMAEISKEEMAEKISREAMAEISREEMAEKISMEEMAEKISREEMAEEISREEMAEKISVPQEEVSEPGKSDVIAFEKQAESLTDIISTDVFVDNLHTNTASSSKGRKKKRNQRPGLAPSTQPTKKARISQGDAGSNKRSPSYPINYPAAETTDASLTAVPSRLNGIGTISSPGHSSQTSDSDTGHIQQRDKPVTAQFPDSFPSRRSSRTPVPSKKLLDAWEEFPVRRTAFVERRTLSLSSDEELSGLCSGDIRQKKQKATKQTFSPSKQTFSPS